MNLKRILLSIAMLVVVGGIITGGTIAYYSDSETSQGNVFAAGTIDLKVDHTRQTYNGVDCQTCSLTIYSSEETEVIGSNEAASNSDGSFPYNASEVSDPHLNWADEDDLEPAQWIWEDSSTDPVDTTNDAEYTFENRFQWNGGIEDITFELGLAADNGYKIVLNGTTIVDELDEEHNYESVVDLTSGQKDDFEDAIQLGENVLQITVRNHSGSSDPDANPAGLLFLLDIERQDCAEGVGDFQQACMLWNETDLGDNHQFWNFGDIKPGDWGTNVISLHVYDNDAYLCLDAFNEEGEEPNGENIADYINILSWIDDDGDGVFDPEDEDLGTTTLSGLDSLASFEPGDDHFLTGSSTEYISLAWCAGDIDVNEGGITCDGSSVDNDAQGSSYSASLMAYVEQVRNNENFSCENIETPEVE